jgi:hypothetical protein
MSADEIQVRASGIDSPEGQIVMDLCNAFKEASLSVGLDPTAPQTALYLATASAMFCGSQFGFLEIVGAMLPKDQRRFVESMTTNIRQGIKVGRSMAARIEQEIIGGTRQ